MLLKLRAGLSPGSPGRTLGAAAAADKGVRLSAEALERYGAAINGEERREGTFSGEGEGHAGQDREHPREGELPFARKGGGASSSPADPADPAELRKKIETIEANQPLLRLLNRIPGKHGRRWIVLPFTFLSGGVEFRVSVRILLQNRDVSASAAAERLGVDIVAGSGGRHWLFVLDKAGKTEKNSGPADFRAEITLNPPLSRSASLERELRKLLEPYAAAITLFQGEFVPLWDSRDDVLPSVNEEV
jgi:hypothetical protein